MLHCHHPNTVAVKHLNYVPCQLRYPPAARWNLEPELPALLAVAIPGYHQPIMPPPAAVPFLVAMMLLTGVCNTLLTKYQV